MMAVEHGFARTSLVAPGRIADIVVREQGHGERVSPPRYENDALTFPCYRPRRPPSHPSDHNPHQMRRAPAFAIVEAGVRRFGMGWTTLSPAPPAGCARPSS